MIAVSNLCVGDALLYRGRGPFSWLIRIKTWAPVSHVEVYMGRGLSYASRNGEGVRSFSVQLDEELYAIVRPVLAFDALAATAWHNAHAAGQHYDWVGLLRFFTWGRQSLDKQFCSEYATRLYRAGGVSPFAEDYDADLVSPGMFLSSPAFRVVWRRDGT